ncbi:bifunctional allantoicase/(S)-ureidoglycine aminohydrolase [Gymnodinialimonas sp.]
MSNAPTYAFPPGGMPHPDDDPTGSAIFTDAYAVIPADTQRDIVTSLLPGWQGHRAWILARPLTGFAETFAQYAVEVRPDGGSSAPEPDPNVQAVIFVAKGTARLVIGAETHRLRAGSFVYLPASAPWEFWNDGDEDCGFHWIRKRYVPAEGTTAPEPLITHETDVNRASMPGANGAWATQRFFDPLDLGYDFHINIVNFLPGGRIPFAETHVMEHGLYVLEGTARYLLNTDWVEVGPGDFMWLRAFCPQACIATGDGPFRYLLYKDVNRHPRMDL